MVSSYCQHQSDVARIKANLLLSLVQNNESNRKEYTARLIRSGVLEDDDGAICRAFVSDEPKGCPIKVEREIRTLRGQL